VWINENYQTSYHGEAFVSKDLGSNSQFKKVDWPNKSESETSTFINDFDDEKIYINESDYSYDNSVETKDGFIIYVKVKSTLGYYDLSDKFSIYISPIQ
jgi:hypothetical protein